MFPKLLYKSILVSEKKNKERMVMIKMKDTCLQGYGEKRTRTVLVNVYIFTSSMENYMEIPSKTKASIIIRPHCPIPGYIAKGYEMICILHILK
jgi:hypothetical protein